MTKKNNMELWDQVCKTDPATTKKVNQRGGFTAVCAQAQMKEATEMWGPFGNHWGLEDCKFGLINNAEGAPMEIYMDADFRYPDGTFPISTDAAYRPGNDSRKKLMTDATTKALSKLGFNSDVFEGKFDDNKYVSTLKQEFSSKAMTEMDEAMAEQVQQSSANSKSKEESQAMYKCYEEGLKLAQDGDAAYALIEDARKDYPKMMSYEQGKLKKLIAEVKKQWKIEE